MSPSSVHFAVSEHQSCSDGEICYPAGTDLMRMAGIGDICHRVARCPDIMPLDRSAGSSSKTNSAFIFTKVNVPFVQIYTQPRDSFVYGSVRLSPWKTSKSTLNPLDVPSVLYRYCAKIPGSPFIRSTAFRSCCRMRSAASDPEEEHLWNHG